MRRTIAIVHRQMKKNPPDPALAGSKRLGLRKSPEIGNRKSSPKAIFLNYQIRGEDRRKICPNRLKN
ncbi:MAG: hypothetical protein V2A64_01250 [Candidatus Omnitrophota bacterium]